MEKQERITSFQAVKGLWLGGWYGLLTGMNAGTLIGMPLGVLGAFLAAGDWSGGKVITKEELSHPILFIIMVAVYGIAAASCGVLVGALIGGVTGLPAGVLAASWSRSEEDCRERRGRVGGALAAFLIGSVLATVSYFYSVKHDSVVFEREPWLLWLLLGAVPLFSLVGYLAGWSADYMLVKGDKHLVRFDARVRAQRIYTVRGPRRALCIAWALLPVFLLYGSLIAWHLRR